MQQMRAHNNNLCILLLHFLTYRSKHNFPQRVHKNWSLAHLYKIMWWEYEYWPSFNFQTNIMAWNGIARKQFSILKSATVPMHSNRIANWNSKSCLGGVTFIDQEWMQKITNKKPPNQACSLIGRVGPHLRRSPQRINFSISHRCIFHTGWKKTASCSQWAPKQIHLYFKCKIRLHRISNPSNFLCYVDFRWSKCHEY